jgi:iron(III) transport system substrate-binding protein
MIALPRLTAGRWRPGSIGILVLAAGLAGPAFGADLPEPTRAMLKALKMDASVLSGLDRELEVPADWVAKARTEGKVRYLGLFSRDEWPVFIAPFKARYPFIDIQHTRTGRVGRVDKVLIAFKEGRVIADVLEAVGAAMKSFREAGALTDLGDLPNFTRILPGMRAKDGVWVGERVKYWCIAYNTKLLKKQDLPKRWEDILTIKALHNGNIGLTNRPHNWVLNLWLAHGEAWTRDYLDKLFTTVRPQLRKEGARALVALTIAGEFHAGIPSTDYGVHDYSAKGAPIGWHCPEPVPVAISELVIVKGSKTLNSARIFLNWFLSKEGQLSQFHAAKASPVHKDLQDKGLVKFGNEIKGKSTALRPPESLVAEFPKIQRVWNEAWSRAGGPMAATKVFNVKTVLTAIKRGGRVLRFKVKAGEHEVKMSKSRSEVLIGGKASARGKLKAGMACEIAYLGNGNEARKVSCQ